MPTIFSSFCGFLDEARAKHVLIGGRVWLGFRLRAGGDVELDHRVIFVGGSFRRTVALALLRHDVDQDRAGLHVADVLQNGEQMVEIMAVDRADIIEAELLEQRAAVHHEAAGIFLDAVGAVGDDFRQPLVDLLGRFAQRAIGLAGIKPRQIRAHRADRRGDRHVIVVEDHDQPRIHRAGIVHGLIGHAGTHRAVADHGNHVVLAAGEVAGDSHAEAGGNRGRGMRGAERIVVALAALGETGQPAAGAQGADAVAAPGQDLVRIGLMADVPDQAIARRVEHVVDRGGQFHHAEAGAEVAAGHRDRVNRFLTKLISDLLHLLDLELAQIVRSFDGVEKRSFTECGHSDIPVLHVGTRSDEKRVAHESAARTQKLGCHLSRPKPNSLAYRHFKSFNVMCVTLRRRHPSRSIFLAI